MDWTRHFSLSHYKADASWGRKLLLLVFAARTHYILLYNGYFKLLQLIFWLQLCHLLSSLSFCCRTSLPATVDEEVSVIVAIFGTHVEHFAGKLSPQLVKWMLVGASGVQQQLGIRPEGKQKSCATRKTFWGEPPKNKLFSLFVAYQRVVESSGMDTQEVHGVRRIGQATSVDLVKKSFPFSTECCSNFISKWQPWSWDC